MKRHLNLVGVLMFAATFSSCEEQQGTSTEPAGSTPGVTTPDASVTPAPMPEIGGIDHARDIKEFELKRSLSGVESLIEDLKAKGADTSELEAQKKDLEQKLAEVQGG
jgi:hypothetical protein